MLPVLIGPGNTFSNTVLPVTVESDRRKKIDREGMDCKRRSTADCTSQADIIRFKKQPQKLLIKTLKRKEKKKNCRGTPKLHGLGCWVFKRFKMFRGEWKRHSTRSHHIRAQKSENTVFFKSSYIQIIQLKTPYSSWLLGFSETVCLQIFSRWCWRFIYRWYLFFKQRLKLQLK